MKVTFAALAVLAAVPAAAQVPAGTEFQVNTHTPFNQWMSSAAADPRGGFVLVWTSENQDGSGLGVYGRRFDAAGVPRGGEFRANGTTAGNQSSAAVAVDDAGNFAVAWASADASGTGVFARRFDRTGAVQGPEFQVNTYTTGAQEGPVLAFDTARNLMVAWTGAGEGDGAGLFGQRFDASGARSGPEFRVNDDTRGVQHGPVLAADGLGRLLAVWNSGAEYGIWLRRYGATGVSDLNAFIAGSSGFDILVAGPGLAVDRAGGFVVTYAHFQYTPPRGRPDALPSGTFARRHSAAGTLLSTTQVDAIHGWIPAAGDGHGGYVVAWAGGSSLSGRRVDLSNAFRGDVAFNVTPSTTEPTKAVVSDEVGNLLGAWTSSGGDGQANGVLARRFGGIVPAGAAVDTVATAGANGNGVLEPNETEVDVRPAWRNVNGAAQTFDGIALDFTGPAVSGIAYVVHDGSGSYGNVGNGAVAACTGCYQVGVGEFSQRPVTHWDAVFTERLTPDVLGQTKPWVLHVGRSFGDVPPASPHYRDVETLFHRGVSAGCATGYCPGAPTTREQMASFLLAAREGAPYKPRACTAPSMFGDVPASSPFCDVIEELARRGVTGGCGGGNYCPTTGVSRAQMSVFLLRTLDPALNPPACTTPRFADVPAGDAFCRWIEELARRGVTAGCGGGNFCPAAIVTREQMATFITGTFGLTLYGP
jgi:hypothetical protein